jgi:hypothetical protein
MPAAQGRVELELQDASGSKLDVVSFIVRGAASRATADAN